MAKPKNANPLNQYFRAISAYITLPSGTNFYDPSVLEYTEDGEIAIRAMTSVDELGLKNPDALLNGKAVCEMLESCVPSLKNPKKLLQNDLEVLIIAIRKASYGDDMDIYDNCPECKKDNKYTVQLSEIEETKKMLETPYFIELREGLKVYVKPYDYDASIKSNKIAFEQMKVARTIESENDDVKLAMFNKSFNEISVLNFELISASVYQIEAEGVEEPVTDNQFITEFLQNIEVHEEKLIENLIKEINSIGVTKEMQVKCENCKHEWATTLTFDPTSFFTES